MKVAYQGEPGAYSERAVAVALPRRGAAALRHRAAGVLARDERRGGVRRGAARELPGGVGQRDLRPACSTPACSGSSARSSSGWITRCSACPALGSRTIRRARSHWQALAQCEEFLSSMRIEPVPVHDTAGAARMIAESGDRDEAAIASVEAAANFGLAVLAERIQTEKENFTKFAVIGTGDPGLGAGRQDLAGDGGPGRAGVALGALRAVRRARDQPPQAGVAAPPRQAVRVRDLRRRDGGGRRPGARGGAAGGRAAHLDAARARVLPRRRRDPV